MSEMIERSARAICANSPGGFCGDVGGDLGCKNGRGLAPHWSNCIASADQLGLCGHANAARAALEAMRERTEPMLDAGTAVLMPHAQRLMPGSTAVSVWEAMIDAAIGTPSSPSPHS